MSKTLAEAIVAKDYELAEKLMKESINRGISEVLESQLPPNDKQTLAANDTTSSDSPGGAEPADENDGDTPGAGEGIPDEHGPAGIVSGPGQQDKGEGLAAAGGGTPVEDAIQPQNDAVQGGVYNSKVADQRGGPGKPWPLEGEDEPEAEPVNEG